MVSLDDVLSARALAAPYVRTTPLLSLSEGLALKLEHHQLTGTFKARGAFARQIAALDSGELNPEVGIVTASGGNAGLAHAVAAASLGHPATVFVPESAPAAKVDRLLAAGARVERVGQAYADAFAAAKDFEGDTGATFCHAYDQADVVAGAGGVAVELLEQLPDVDTVVVSVGGGGLLAGIIAGLDGRAAVIAVEPENCPTLHSALAAGEPVDVEVSGLAADALGATRIGDLAWEAANAAGEGLASVLVSDEEIAAARSALWEVARIAVEPAAAAAHAALLSGAYIPAEDERVAVIICGANTDPATVLA